MNREQWLNAAADKINTVVFAPHDVKAVNFRESTGFPAGARPFSSEDGSIGGAIGQCWNSSTSAGNMTEMFISPVLSDAISEDDNNNGVLETLVHEMDHCIVGTECAHKGPFKRLALKIGLEGPMKSTHAGPVLNNQLRAIAAELGKYPHEVLTPAIEKKGTKGSRLIKVVCPECDNVARQAKTPFLTYGLVCGACNVPMVADS